MTHSQDVLANRFVQAREVFESEEFSEGVGGDGSCCDHFSLGPAVYEITSALDKSPCASQGVVDWPDACLRGL